MPRHQPSNDLPLTASVRTTVTTALDNVRRQLQQAGATARGTAPSIHQSCDFESDQPDFGCLCELVAELIESVASKLVVVSVLQARSLGLAIAIEAQRRRLRRTRAVLCSMTYFLRTAPLPGAPNLLVVLSSLTATCQSVLTALDPVALGLPIPAPDTWFFQPSPRRHPSFVLS